MGETAWSPAQQQFCCSTMGRGCTTALPETTPTVPPTPFPTPPPTPPPTLPPTQTKQPSGPVDPFNCAVDPENTWAADKKELLPSPSPRLPSNRPAAAHPASSAAYSA